MQDGIRTAPWGGFVAAWVALAAASPAIGQTPPQPGWALSAQFGPGWTSNPNDLPGRQKGDGHVGWQTSLSYRQPLWTNASLTVSSSLGSTLYARERDAGGNRLSGGVTLGQTWQGATFTLGFTARTSMDQPLQRHDEASQDVSIGVSRSVILAPDWTLIPSLGASRRFYQNGSKNDVRFRGGLILARKWHALTARLGVNASYLLEDNTPILPRIRDRSVSAFASATYEWAKERDIGLRVAVSRTYSTYAPNRYKSLSVAPQVSATFRF